LSYRHLGHRRCDDDRDRLAYRSRGRSLRRSLRAVARLSPGELNDQRHDVVIEQAKGILAERLGIDVDAAFTTLRGHARSHRRHLSDLAQAVIAGTEDFTPTGRPADPPQ
jgi:AmiR/NasT family two-component response regulator